MEKMVQDRLFEILFNVKKNGKNRFYWITPNIKFFNWESDLLFKDDKDRIYEFEIKSSRADFLADFENKKDKHERLSTGGVEVPSYFYFICQEGQVLVSEIPEYAGLYLYRVHAGKIEIYCSKSAPLLTDVVFDFRANLKLANSIYFKYWRSRIGKITKTK